MAQPTDRNADSDREPTERGTARIELTVEATLRRSGHRSYRVHVHDFSPRGCRAEFVERPSLNEIVRVKFDDLEAIEAKVCWIRGPEMGLEFNRPIYPAVFDMLVARFKR